MPLKPKRPCSYPGCPSLTDDRYCMEHKQKFDREYNKNRPYKKLYGGAKWKQERKLYLQEHPLCVICLKDDRTKEAAVVDHIHRIKEMNSFSGRNPTGKLCVKNAMTEKLQRKTDVGKVD